MYVKSTQPFTFFRRKRRALLCIKGGFIMFQKIICIFHCKISGLTIFITCSAVEGTGELASSDAEIKGSATLGSTFNTDS